MGILGVTTMAFYCACYVTSCGDEYNILLGLYGGDIMV